MLKIGSGDSQPADDRAVNLVMLGENGMVPSEIKLLKILSNHDAVFYIPPYQRNYEWTEEQCKVFYDDVIKTMESNKKGEKTEHFFGSIMYVEENTSWMQPDRWILVDGQQRITTAMLFLMAIRDLANNKKIAISIDAKYLVNGETRAEGEYKSKLKQVEGDYGAYKHLILEKAPIRQPVRPGGIRRRNPSQRSD